MLRSVRRHSPDVDLIVLAIGLSCCEVQRIEAQFPACSRWQVRPLDPRIFDAATINSRHLSRAAYAPLFLDDILPDRRRVIWLDADTIVLGDLSPLWVMDLDGGLIAATPDDFISEDELAATKTQAGSYFNSGVMVLDLENWRASGFGVRARARMLAGNLICEDQSVLNELARGRVTLLERTWNFHAMRFHEYRPGLRPPAPRIVHFCGQLKPWNAEVPFRRLFLDYLPTDHHRMVQISPRRSLLRRIELARRRLFGLLVGRSKHWRALRDDISLAKAVAALRSSAHAYKPASAAPTSSSSARRQSSWPGIVWLGSVSRPKDGAR